MRKPPRKRVVVFRVDESEYGRLETHQKRSNARTISDYCRATLLDNPALVALRSAFAVARFRHFYQLPRTDIMTTFQLTPCKHTLDSSSTSADLA